MRFELSLCDEAKKEEVGNQDQPATDGPPADSKRGYPDHVSLSRSAHQQRMHAEKEKHAIGGHHRGGPEHQAASHAQIWAKRQVHQEGTERSASPFGHGGAYHSAITNEKTWYANREGVHELAGNQGKLLAGNAHRVSNAKSEKADRRKRHSSTIEDLIKRLI